MKQTERRRRKREGEGAWPNPRPGAAVILHTRVVTDTGGGPDKTIFNSAAFLGPDKYWQAAAYMHPPRDPGFALLRKRAEEAGCPLIGVPDKGPLDRGVFRRLLSVCKRYDVRIWHGHDYKSNMLGLMLRPFWNMKLITTVHGWVKHTLRTPLYYAVDRWSLPYYHHVICVSDDLLEQVRKLGVPEDRCTLLENGIDEKRFQRRHPASESALRQKFGVPEGRLVVGAMGRLSAEKAFNNLIRAVHGLITLGIDVELWIGGEGDARPELEALIKRLHVEDRVRLLGYCEDTLGFYEGLDAFVLSSLREGLPNVVLEAMAMEVPVVSTKVAGVPRLITDGQNGLLCPVGDSGALAVAMRHLLTDQARRRTLAQAGRQTIESQWSFARRVAREREIYDRVLGGPG